VSSGPSNEASAKPVSSVPPVPPAPTNLTAVAGNGQVTLSWTAVTVNGVTYNLYRGTAAGAEGATAIKSGLTSPSFVDTDLPNGSVFFYRVSATANGATSGLSNETSAQPMSAPATTSALPPVPPMSNVQAQVSGNTVNITFDPVDGAKDYRA